MAQPISSTIERERPAAEEAGVAVRPAVSSHNEWDPLEEVVVGVVDGAAVPAWDAALAATMPVENRRLFEQLAGRPFPRESVAAANRDLDELVHILEGEGVVVRRPEAIDFSRPYSTPDWRSAGGLYAAMPRDLLLVIGDEIIECPLAWRSRYFEVNAFRPLLKEYFQRGARWTAAPRPELPDRFFRPRPAAPPDGDEPERFVSVISEFEPTFDAADFIRCGRDLFVQRSHVTNAFGIDWLARHLGDAYRIHEIEVADAHPMHVDATVLPLAPGKLLVNPERLHKVPPALAHWDVLTAPPPEFDPACPMYMSSRWISMNILMLDEERILVERSERAFMRLLRDWGFKPIPCSFTGFYAFGGSFHCATLDVRRRGELRSYC
jgi:glycine amidinotransferase